MKSGKLVAYNCDKLTNVWGGSSAVVAIVNATEDVIGSDEDNEFR